MLEAALAHQRCDLRIVNMRHRVLDNDIKYIVICRRHALDRDREVGDKLLHVRHVHERAAVHDGVEN
jgi:hypothetical protein